MDASPESRRPERPLTPLLAAMWTVALVFTEITCDRLVLAARGNDIDIVSGGACTALATSIVIFVMLRVHAPEASVRRTLGVTPIAPLHLALSAAAGAGLYPLLSTIDDLIVKRWPYEDPEGLERLLAVPTLRMRVGLVVATFVVVPIAEELFYRGIVFGGVARSAGVRAAMVTSALLFPLSDFDWRSIPTTLLLGLALVRLRERTRTVAGPIAAHLAFFAVAGVPILAGRDPAADVVFPTKWIVGGAAVALLALVGVGAGQNQE